MGKWTKESHGFDMLRPIAEKMLQDPKKKRRVWSEPYGAWGFFEDMNQEDEFLFWSVLQNGDRVELSSFGFGEGEVGMVVGISRTDDGKRRVKILLSNCRMIELSIEEGRVFRLGWQFIA